ncbi:phosphotransferase enzyme family protein [Actinomadura opuntiae]|uniref:phosphotransferase enzyme family protein n=1 Tax=Actinomadura sp. OS1-43 TaxID=604315 RepID=UPI00255AA235|nr:phosphotransferase [Actinomadura sp. OS1-43]MDL4813949.1 phosphotransferase [Actinomadura sp. OS1-43]
MPTSRSADEHSADKHSTDPSAAGAKGGERPEDEGPPPRLLKRWGLDATQVPEALAGGRCWRVRTSGGPFCLKEYAAHDRRRVLFQHEVTGALDAAGLPVLAPLPARTGRTLVTASGHGYALYPWVAGRERGGLELTFRQCEELGELLGRLHAELERITPPVQQSLLVPTPRAADAAAAVESMLESVPADGGGTDFEALTARRLRERRALLAEFAGHQPPEIDVSTVGHLHGAFHAGHLRYAGAGNVTAVLGWDALTTGPVAGEVVRAAARLFACEDERGLDLDRVQAFVRGHRAAFPLDAGQIQSAVHREWWERLCDVAPLRHRYLGEEGTGERGPAGLVSWWSAQLERTLDAFAAPYTGPFGDPYAEVPDDSTAYG